MHRLSYQNGDVLTTKDQGISRAKAAIESFLTNFAGTGT